MVTSERAAKATLTTRASPQRRVRGAEVVPEIDAVVAAEELDRDLLILLFLLLVNLHLHKPQMSVW